MCFSFPIVLSLICRKEFSEEEAISSKKSASKESPSDEIGFAEPHSTISPLYEKHSSETQSETWYNKENLIYQNNIKQI